jgi:ABC-2 type transport system permease protein
MTSARAYFDAAVGVFRRDFALFASYRMRFITTVFSTFVSLTLFYYVSRLVSSDRVGARDAHEYYGFVVVGIIVFEVLTSTLSLPLATLRAELLAGTFERMVLSPFGAVRCIMSLLLFPVALAVTTAVVSLVFASLVFGLQLVWPDVLLALPVGLLGALAFAPFGLLMAAAVVVVKQTNAGATFVVTGVTLLAGVYFPVTLLPGWISWASDVQPFTPAVDLLRHVLVGTPLRTSATLGLVKLIGFPIVMLPACVYALSGAVNLSRRRGTIIEY